MRGKEEGDILVKKKKLIIGAVAINRGVGVTFFWEKQFLSQHNLLNSIHI